MGQYDEMIVNAARKWGIDPSVAMRVAKSEGGTNDWIQSRVVTNGRQEPSFGPFQMLVGGEGTGFGKGMGNDALARGIDPRKPSPEYFDFAMQQAKQQGWRPWYGAANTGISTWEGIKNAGTTLTSYPPQASGTPAPPITDTRTIQDAPVAAVQPDAAAPATAAEGPGLWAQLKEGDLKGAWSTLKEGVKDAAAGDEEGEGGADSWASAMTGTGTKAQAEQDRENANIQPSSIGATIGAEQAQRVAAAQQMMAQLMASKKLKKGKVPGLSMMG